MGGTGTGEMTPKSILQQIVRGRSEVNSVNSASENMVPNLTSVLRQVPTPNFEGISDFQSP